MAISYVKIARTPYVFRQLTGLTTSEFEKNVAKVRPEWEKMEAKKKCHGRKSHVERLEDRILCVLIYYRTYITHPFLGFLFNLHNSNICRLLKKMEPLLARKITIKKDRTLTPERVLKIHAAHGTNGWALFSAWAFAKGQLLPGNEIKLTGMFANSGENRGSTGNGRNFVSTIPLLKPLSIWDKYLPSLEIPSNWSGPKNGYVSYKDLQKKFTEKYSKRSLDNALTEEIKQAFNVNMQEVYHKLSCMKVVIIGDGIGNAYKTRFYGAGDVAHEVLYERVNIRAVLVNKEDKDFVKKFLKLINPELFETIALFTTKEMEEFEQSRNNPQGNGFIADFINAFKDRLPFKFFDKVKIIGANKCFLSKATSKKRAEYYGMDTPEVEFSSGFVLYSVESSVDDSEHIKPFIKKIADIYNYINYFNENKNDSNLLKCNYNRVDSAYPSLLDELNSYKGHNKCELEKMLKPVREFLDKNRERMAEIIQDIALKDIKYLFSIQESVQQKKDVHFANGVQNYWEETSVSHTKQPERKMDKSLSSGKGQIPSPQTTPHRPQSKSSAYDNEGFGKEIMSVVGAIAGAIIGATIAYLAGAATLPIVAIAVISAVPGVLIGCGIAEICEKVSREQQNDHKMGILTALSIVLTPEWLNGNVATKT